MWRKSGAKRTQGIRVDVTGKLPLAGGQHCSQLDTQHGFTSSIEIIMFSQAQWLHATRRGPRVARVGLQGNLARWANVQRSFAWLQIIRSYADRFPELLSHQIKDTWQSRVDAELHNLEMTKQAISTLDRTRESSSLIVRLFNFLTYCSRTYRIRCLPIEGPEAFGRTIRITQQAT